MALPFEQLSRCLRLGVAELLLMYIIFGEVGNRSSAANAVFARSGPTRHYDRDAQNGVDIMRSGHGSERNKQLCFSHESLGILPENGVLAREAGYGETSVNNLSRNRDGRPKIDDVTHRDASTTSAAHDAQVRSVEEVQGGDVDRRQDHVLLKRPPHTGGLLRSARA